jgi:hypothetical protein
MIEFSAQYLEENPVAAGIPTNLAMARLQSAFDILPIANVLLGWKLPDDLITACRQITEKNGATLYRWHPLLTVDGSFSIRPEWMTVNINLDPIRGYKGQPEFTFLCPNNPAVQNIILENLNALVEKQLYEGVFLDRIRFPSPNADPLINLACFCRHCHEVAASQGLDLEEIRRRIYNLLASRKNIQPLISGLLNSRNEEQSDPELSALSKFLDFRQTSISNFLALAAGLIRSAGWKIGLDCFSPCLTRSVGQDLSTLNAFCNWIKIMSYGHTLGPAGIPFELFNLADLVVKTLSYP